MLRAKEAWLQASTAEASRRSKNCAGSSRAGERSCVWRARSFQLDAATTGKVCRGALWLTLSGRSSELKLLCHCRLKGKRMRGNYARPRGLGETK